MSDLPTQQKALILGVKNGNFDLGDTNVSQPGPGQLLIKIKATALNPVDWKIQKYGIFIEEYPAIVGVDYSGEIVALGQGVIDFKVGIECEWSPRFTQLGD
jgi:NADPH:quinone reductase-like Zn-dependent oxidoreductase